MRKEAENVSELVSNLQSLHPSELVVGLPYYVVGTLIDEGCAPPDPVTFRDLANNFEVDFRRKVMSQEAPKSISQNPEWLEKWNLRGEGIIKASEERQSKPPYSE
jgi:hypothetical protein